MLSLYTTRYHTIYYKILLVFRLNKTVFDELTIIVFIRDKINMSSNRSSGHKIIW